MTYTSDDIFGLIDEGIKAFSDEKDGAIVVFQRITDEASNKKYYNDTYENFKYTCDSLFDIKNALEDPSNDSLSDEDADRIVTKLEELIAAEKPLFDHFNTYADEYQGDGILYPWDNISSSGSTDRGAYVPGFIDDLFKEHNYAWEQIGEYLYNKYPSLQKRIWDDISQFEKREWTCTRLNWRPVPETEEDSE